MKIFFLVITVSAFTITIHAQSSKTISDKPTSEWQDKDGKPKTPEQRAQQSIDKLDKIVILTTDQKTQIYNLALTRAKNVDTVREKYKGQSDKKEQIKQEVQSIHKEYRQSAKKILTPNQINKLKEYHKTNKSKKESDIENQDIPVE